jgi:hypothetical protein
MTTSRQLGCAPSCHGISISSPKSRPDKVRDPVGVNLREASTCIQTLLRLQGTNENTVRGEQVIDGSAFRQELRVGKNIEAAIRLRVGFKDRTHGLGGATWNGRLFDDNLARIGDLSNTPGGKFDVAKQG